MSKRDVIKAWKNPGYRNTLSAEQLGAMPANPAGVMEIADEAIGVVAAGAIPTSFNCATNITCTAFPTCRPEVCY